MGSIPAGGIGDGRRGTRDSGSRDRGSIPTGGKNIKHYKLNVVNMRKEMSSGLLNELGLKPVDLDREGLGRLARKAAGKGGKYFNPNLQERVDNSLKAVARRKKEMASAEEWSAAAGAQGNSAEWVKKKGRAERPESYRKVK